MISCEVCSGHSTCKKVCETVAKLMSDEGIRSAEWIRPQGRKRKGQRAVDRWLEIPFSSLGFVPDKDPLMEDFNGA